MFSEKTFYYSLGQLSMWRTCYFQLRWARVRYMVFFLQPPAVNMFSYPRPESQLNLAWVQFQIEAKDIAGNPSVFRISIVGPARFAAWYRDETRERERGAIRSPRVFRESFGPGVFSPNFGQVFIRGEKTPVTGFFALFARGFFRPFLPLRDLPHRLQV